MVVHHVMSDLTHRHIDRLTIPVRLGGLWMILALDTQRTTSRSAMIRDASANSLARALLRLTPIAQVIRRGPPVR